MTEKDPQGDAASSQRPRSPRVPVEFALDVEGTDAAGTPFQTKATATKISRGGATIALDVDAVNSKPRSTAPGPTTSTAIAASVLSCSTLTDGLLTNGILC
jgi:hypothetical protein